MIQVEDACISESRSNLRRELRDGEYRYAYAEDFLNTWIATQIVTLREQRGLSQAALGSLIGTKQPGVSRLEDVNHATWKTETLKRIARALGVRLRISFETFGTLIEENATFSRESLRRPDFKDDPAFRDRKGPAMAVTRVPMTSGGVVTVDPVTKHCALGGPTRAAMLMLKQAQTKNLYATTR